jgi:DNA-binding response OmpR family regulator
VLPVPRILVVEDNPATRDIFGTALRHAGYDVLLAGDGETALQTARQEQPDLILLDFSLPKLDGLACLRILKLEEVTKKIPVIAVTAHGQIEYRIQASTAGADGYLAKPVDPREVVAAVEALVGRPVREPQK